MKTSMPTPDFTLITLDYPPDQGGVARYLGNLVLVSQGGINVIHDELRFFRRRWPKWWPLVGLCRSVVRTNRSIILVSHVLPVGTAALISKMFGGPEYAVIFHGLDIRLAHSVWKKFLLRRICRRAKALIANSQATKHDLLKLAPKVRISVITPGVEEKNLLSKKEARNRLGLNQDKKIVLSVGRLVRRKGFDMSLKAMAEIQKKHEVDYVILGHGSDLEKLERIAAENKTKVRWLLNAGDEEKWLWYFAADVFLLPVRDEDCDVEGFGIVYLEAGMAGVPSIAGQSGGASEAVRHERTGLLVNPNSSKEIVEAIDVLLSDDVKRETLGKQARDRVLKEFQWKERWDKLEQIIKFS